MQTPVFIDVNKFMDSFSIKVKAKDGRDIHPPSWIEGEGDSVTFSTTIPSSSSLAPSQKPFTMDIYCRVRQAEEIRWINLQEKRASIIPRLQLHRRSTKCVGMPFMLNLVDYLEKVLRFSIIPSGNRLLTYSLYRSKINNSNTKV